MTTLKLFDNISRKTDVLPKLGYGLFWLALFVASLGAGNNAYAAVQCDKTITAHVVVFDSPTIFNRLGAQNPNWITYALERDVVHKSGPQAGQVCRNPDGTPNGCAAGNVELRPDKRPRPLVIRSVEGACLTVHFTNWLTDLANPNNEQQGPPGVLINNNQVAGRCAGFHATGTELVNGTEDDGSMTGANNGGGNAGNTNSGQDNCGEGLAAPGQSRIYELYTPHEGAYIINSYGATLGSEANGGNLGLGMFGALNVQPKGARIYRSQVTEEEMRIATTGHTDLGQPIINYETLYPNGGPWPAEGKAGLPIINMLHGADCGTAGWSSCELVHSDINAIIAGPDADGSWYSKCPNDEDPDTPDECPYPLESVGKKNPQLPNRLEAFREFTSQYHDEQTNSQVFPNWYNNPVMSHVLHGVGDAFMINYGSGGIGSEIIANRLHTGPMHDCTDCAYEEFFLASQTVGDPALLVAFPANTGIEACDPAVIAGTAGGQAQETQCWRDKDNLANGPIRVPDGEGGFINNFALFQEDPSNVHHAYTGDFVKLRNTHAGAFEQHIFHFHNHQWLFNPNDDNANYLDAQEIMPGSGHTYELVNGGAGNRNHTVGDAIFHCHFYPHFAQGMWYHMRNHDVFEAGTVLAVSDVNPAGTPDNPYPAQKAPDFDPLKPELNFHDGRWDLRSGEPMARSRALPDGELPDGSPIPAIIPLPGNPMPPMPAHVEIRPVDRGAHSLLGGRMPPDGNPDSSQAVVNRASTVDADGNPVSPGYPFWLAGNECGPAVDPLTAPALLKDAPGLNACPQGIVGQRMPTPPLDMLTDAGAQANAGNPNTPEKLPDGTYDPESGTDWSNLGGGWDGGLPRHALLGYVSGSLSLDTQNRLDFRKIVEIAKPVYFPETGTDLEQVSMAYQAIRRHPSFETLMKPVAGNRTAAGNFVLNGAPGVPGGPYNDPCVDDNGVQLKDGHVGRWYDGDDLERWTNMSVTGRSPFDAENPRTYKLANLQIDAVFNKVGYHYSQERIIILWDDVAPTIQKIRPPEPLVMRFNTFDCGKILHANLVPAEFEVDDFQVRTPTDIIGQHIHLPKWDLTTNDGAANGWNYEDGALAPAIVDERIHAINNYNKLAGKSIGVVQAAIDLGFADKVHPELVQVLLDNNTTLNLTDQDPVLTIDTGDPGGTAAGLGCLEDPATGACPGGQGKLIAKSHPFFGDGGAAFGGQDYLGTRTVIQRILVDPVVNVSGVDRGLGLTFSHDHYGPSTFQQIGLYSTILAEPAGSTWVHNESGQPLYGRQIKMADGTDGGTDGGPTSWQAAILTGTVGGYGDNVGGAEVPEHREFYFEMSDFQHAYEHDVYIGADENGVPKLAEIVQPNPFNATVAEISAAAPGMDDPRTSWLQAVNPTLKLTAGMGVAADAFPDTVNAHPGCPGDLGQNDPNVPRPCAEAINIGHSSMWVVNYRNEPIALRVFDPNKAGPDGSSGSQADGQPGDLALAFQSRNDRAISLLNDSFGLSPYPQASYCQNNGDGINCDRASGDPFTPIMRAYENDLVKVKIQVGATEEQHQTTIHGVKWLSNGSAFGRSPNSGWRNFQSHGISEQFTLHMPIIPDRQNRGNTTDYLYATDATRDGIWGGTWGILRTYQNGRNDLLELPNNPINGNVNFVNDGNFQGVCPKFVLDENGEAVGKGKGRNKVLIETPVRQFDVFAVKANDVLPNNLDVIINANLQVDVDGDGIPDGGNSAGGLKGDNVGGPLDPDGGTLVYNRRGTGFSICEKGFNEDGSCADGLNRNVAGPLNDPTALMYVLEEDLEPRFLAGPDGKKHTLDDISPDDKGWRYDSDGNPVEGPNYKDGIDDRCQDVKDNGDVNWALHRMGCPVKLKATAPVEPLVLRAEAGDCIEATLWNKLLDQATAGGSPVYTSGGTAVFDELVADKNVDSLVDYYGNPVNRADLVFEVMPDLAGWQDTFWVVNRDLFKPVADRNQQQMSFFGNNLIRPSAMAGLHAQLVEYDASQDDGVVVGQNPQSIIAGPGQQHTYRWYAGHIESVYKGMSGKGKNQKRDFVRLAFPVEFGGANLLSADRVKQPQKGMFGALVIEPKGAIIDDSTLVADGQMACATFDEVPGSTTFGKCTAIDPAGTRKTRAQVTVTAPAGTAASGGSYREAVAVTHKITNLRWADGSTVKNVGQPEFGVEGAEDSGHAGYNYGMEPSWFRFKIAPDAPSAGAKKETVDGQQVPVDDRTYGTIPNVQAMFANALVENELNAIPNIPGVAVAGDPQTPVFRTTADVDVDPGPDGELGTEDDEIVIGANPVFDTRMHVLNGASADRDSTFILHGHVWQRDPFVCTGVLGSEEDMDVANPGDGDAVSGRKDTDVNLEGRCDPSVIAPSNALGLNRQAKYMGGEEGMGHVFGHWPILFDAGGTGAVTGDYLFRDYAPNGSRNGMFGILRVE